MYVYSGVTLIILFAIYLVYLVFVKKDMKAVRSITGPALLFLSAWILIYFLIFSR